MTIKKGCLNSLHVPMKNLIREQKASFREVIACHIYEQSIAPGVTKVLDIQDSQTIPVVFNNLS